MTGAIQRQTIEAGRLLTTATAIRSYTDTNVAPSLKAASADSFHVETVPAFAAQTVYRTVQGSYPGYTYREPALKPTNPSDLPTPFEVGLINKFRADPQLKELTGVRDEGDGRVYYVARPIVAHDACLACHDTPQRSAGGHGRQVRAGERLRLEGERGRRHPVPTVPAAEELKETGELALILGGGLLVVFIAVYFALTISIDSLVVRPLTTLAAAADRASRDGTRAELPTSGDARSASFRRHRALAARACRKP